MMIGVYQGRHIGEEVAGMGSPCGWGDVLLLLDILLLQDSIQRSNINIDNVQKYLHTPYLLAEWTGGHSSGQ